MFCFWLSISWSIFYRRGFAYSSCFSLVPRHHPRGLDIRYRTSITYLVTRPHPALAHVHARGLHWVYYVRDLTRVVHMIISPTWWCRMTMGDKREPDQSTKLKQAIDILSSICSGNTSGTTSGDTSGGSSASRGGSQRHPDRLRARDTGILVCNCCV